MESEFIARCPNCGTTYDGREDPVEGIQGWHPGEERWNVDCGICGAPNLEIDHQATEEEEFGCEDDEEEPEKAWSAPELKTRREATGASVRDMARLLGLSSESNYQRYEAGRVPVPTFVVAEVERLERWLEEGVKTVLAVATDLRADGKSETLDLFRWRKSSDYERDCPERAAAIPFGVHARVIAKARELLLDEGFEVELHYPGEGGLVV